MPTSLKTTISFWRREKTQLLFKTFSISETEKHFPRRERRGGHYKSLVQSWQERCRLVCEESIVGTTHGVLPLELIDRKSSVSLTLNSISRPLRSTANIRFSAGGSLPITGCEWHVQRRWWRSCMCTKRQPRKADGEDKIIAINRTA